MPDVPQAPQQTPPPIPPVVPPTPPAVPPAPPKPTTPPAPPVMPPPVPPKPPVAPPPVPPPAPPIVPPPAPKPVAPVAPPAPEMTPHPPSTAHHKLFGALVVIACLLILIVLGFILWPKLHLLQQPQAPAPTVIPITTSTEPTSPAPATTSTEPAATTTTQEPPPADEIRQNKLGESVVLFKNDEAIYLGRKAGEAFKVTAIEFTDSRCPKGVQCIWAGELGVKLRVTDVKNTSQDFYLGMVRAKTVKTMGLTITLLEIDEGKGGMYAKIRVD